MNSLFEPAFITGYGWLLSICLQSLSPGKLSYWLLARVSGIDTYIGENKHSCVIHLSTVDLTVLFTFASNKERCMSSVVKSLYFNPCRAHIALYNFQTRFPSSRVWSFATRRQKVFGLNFAQVFYQFPQLHSYPLSPNIGFQYPL